MSSTATVSVAVTTYNREDSFRECLTRVIGQTSQPNEVIIVDDSSEEPYIYKKYSPYKDISIRRIRHENNLGLASARNTAIFNAKSEFFTWCDDDDIWHPEFLKEVREKINSTPTHIHAYIIYPKSARRFHQKFLGPFPLLTDIIQYGYAPPVSSQIYRTALLKKIGGYNNLIRTGVDHDLWFSLARYNPRVEIIWADLCEVSFRDLPDRITTNYHARMSGILDSLSIWEPTIIELYSRDFFEYYKRAYLIHLRAGFITSCLRTGNFSLLSKLKVNSRDIFSILRRQVSLRLLRRGGLPTFQVDFPRLPSISKY